MFNKTLVVIVGILLSNTIASACDVCGSSSISGSNLYGFSNNKMIGISYNYGSAKYSDLKYDNFNYASFKQVVMLNSLWNFSNSLQAELNIPFEINNRTYINKTDLNRSFGDLQLGMNHFLKLGNDSSWLLKTSLMSEFSISNMNKDFQVVGIQSTSESVDLITSLAIIKLIDMFSIILNSKFKKSMWEYSNYTFGNVWVNEALVSYSIIKNNHVFIPQGGVNTEFKKHDFDNENKLHGTSTKLFFGNVGFQYSNGKWIIGGQYNLPLSTIYAEKGVSISSRINGYLLIIF